MADGPKVLTCCLILLFLVLFIFLVIILPLSYNKCQYYEYCLSVSRLYGTVDRQTIYDHGTYFLAPDKYFIAYPSNVVTVELQDMSIWSKASASDAGTALTVDVTFQYQLKQNEIGLLYNKVGMNFKPYVANLGINAIKNIAPNFSADDFLSNRRNIEKAFQNSVAAILNSDANSNLFSLQLRDVVFTGEYFSRKLSAAIQFQKNAEEEYRKESALTRGMTQEEVNLIDNDAEEILQLSVANAQLIASKAKNVATKIEQDARNNGLKSVVQALNLTMPKHMISLDYLILLDGKKPRTYAGFKQITKTIN